MKTKSKLDKRTLEIFSKLDKFFPSEEKWAITATCLTASEALCETMVESFEPHQMSDKVKYAILQYASMRVIISKILTGNIKDSSEMSLKYMPTVDWDDETSWEEKYLFLVKAFYEQEKKEGRI